jgi:hypothetical protein
MRVRPITTLIGVTFLVMLFLLIGSKTVCAPGQHTSGEKAPTGRQSHAGRNRTSKAKVTTYHRVDFVLSGSSCPLCLRRMARKLKAVEGVTKAEIWPWTPHWGLVIYDARRTQWSVIEQALRYERVTFQDIHDAVLSEKDLRSPARMRQKTD